MVPQALPYGTTAGSFGLLSPMAVEAASNVARWCLGGAGAALGMKASVGALVDFGSPDP